MVCPSILWRLIVEWFMFWLSYVFVVFLSHILLHLDNLAVKPQNLCALRLNIQDAYYVSAARTLLSACKGLRQTGTENVSIAAYIRSDGHSVHGRSIEVFVYCFCVVFKSVINFQLELIPFFKKIDHEKD